MPAAVRETLDWVPMHATMPTHPKSLKLARITGVDRAWSYVMEVCCWAAKNRGRSGSMEDVDPEMIDRVVDWPRKAKLPLLDAMRQVGFIDPDGQIHDWSRYAGAYFVRKEKERVKKEGQRRPKADVPGDNDDDVPGTSLGTSPGTTSGHPPGHPQGSPGDSTCKRGLDLSLSEKGEIPSPPVNTDEHADPPEKRVFDGWHQLYAPTGYRRAATIPEGQHIIGPAIREHGGGDKGANVLLRSLQGHQHEPANDRFRTNPGNSNLRTLKSLLKPDAVSTGLGLMDAHEASQKRSDGPAVDAYTQRLREREARWAAAAANSESSAA